MLSAEIHVTSLALVSKFNQSSKIIFAGLVLRCIGPGVIPVSGGKPLSYQRKEGKAFCLPCCGNVYYRYFHETGCIVPLPIIYSRGWLSLYSSINQYRCVRFCSASTHPWRANDRISITFLTPLILFSMTHLTVIWRSTLLYPDTCSPECHLTGR